MRVNLGRRRLLFADGSEKTEKSEIQNYVQTLVRSKKGSVRFVDVNVRPHKPGAAKRFAKLLGVCLDEGVRFCDVSKRQVIFGFNSYTDTTPRSFGASLFQEMPYFKIIVLLVCGLSDGIEILYSILFLVIIFGLSDYKRYLQSEYVKENELEKVTVTRDGSRSKISTYDLVVGDVVHLGIGDHVPADGVLISGYKLLLDQSGLTGEIEPFGISEECPFLSYGSYVKDGSGKMLVTAVGMKTEWGKFMVTLRKGGEDETALQVKMNGIMKLAVKSGLVLAVFTFLVSTVRFLVEKKLNEGLTLSDTMPLLNCFATAIMSIILAVPDGLPMAVTLSHGFASKTLMNKKALVKHLSVCDNMGSASCICIDKTGTLTKNHMVVEKIWICGFVRATCGGNNNKGDRKLGISDRFLSILLQALFSAEVDGDRFSAEVDGDREGKDTVSRTPIESALLELGLRLAGDHVAQVRNFKILKVVPFNSNRKKISVLTSLPEGGARAFCRGSSEEVLRMCDTVVARKGTPKAISEELVTEITRTINKFSSAAMKTLCLAYKDLGSNASLEDIPDRGYTLLAVLGIKNEVRPGVKEVVKTCLDAGITVRMVTGDDMLTAKAIARECGILTDDDHAIEGPAFRSMPLNEMKATVPKIQVMARSSAEDKYTFVTHLMLRGEVVAMTGDEINDARALKLSDIGLARAVAGTEVAKDNADVIIMDDHFSTILDVAKWGRLVYVNIQKYVQFYLTVIFVALVINFVSACVSGLAPFTVVQLLWINVIIDPFAAWAFAGEPPNNELMLRPPIAKKSNFITKAMWRHIVGQIIYQSTALGVLKFNGERLLGLTGSDASQVLNTVIFNTFVFCQVFNEINSHEIEKINVFKGIFDNWLFPSMIVLTVTLQVIIVEFLGSVAGTVALSWQLWLLSIGLGSVSIVVGALLKYFPKPRHAP